MGNDLSEETVALLPPLSRGFYQRPTAVVAQELLGAVLVRRLPEGLAAVRITEVEAYLGVGDPACHTFGGRRTTRTEVMWGEEGRLYVYFVYGMHWCANLVTAGAGTPEAVLLRGAIPVWGEPLIQARRRRPSRPLLDGPARLCQGLEIDGTLNGADVTLSGQLWVSRAGPLPEPVAVERLPRVGVGYAGEAALWPLRFCLRGWRALGGRSEKSGTVKRKKSPGRGRSR